MRSWRVWWLGLLWFQVDGAMNALNFWTASIIKSSLVTVEDPEPDGTLQLPFPIISVLKQSVAAFVILVQLRRGKP